MSKVAIVTGSNKGIGFAIVKGLCEKFDGIVYLTSRDVARGKAAVAELKKLGLTPEYHQLDVSDKDSVAKLGKYIKERHEGIDILVNNAAVVDNNIASSSYEDSKRVIDVNYRSALTMQDLVYPLLRNNARVLNISSDCGHLSNVRNKYWIEKLSKRDLNVSDINEFVEWFLESKKNNTFKFEDIADGGTVAAYRVAKVSLSALTKIQQKEYESKNISINSMHPGLVRTDMTTGAGFYSTEEAAKTPLYLLLEAPQSLRGEYVWYDGRILDWYDYNADYYFKVKTLTEY